MCETCDGKTLKTVNPQYVQMDPSGLLASESQMSAPVQSSPQTTQKPMRQPVSSTAAISGVAQPTSGPALSGPQESNDLQKADTAYVEMNFGGGKSPEEIAAENKMRNIIMYSVIAIVVLIMILAMVKLFKKKK